MLFFFSLLADIFQNFRRLSQKAYQLEPLHFLTLPSLSLTAALRYTKISLELLSDPNLYMFFEKYKKGGLCYIANRWARLNMPGYPDYDEKQCTSLPQYLDANNL